MSSAALDRRVAFLLESQNSDGGWGYKSGKRSWLEPTVWAMLALHGRPDAAGALNRGWNLVRHWQLADGGCRPNQEVESSNWATSLWVTLHCVRGVYDAPSQRAVDWLLQERGAEGRWWRRTLLRITGGKEEFNSAWCGWSWWPGTSSWLEPTVHAVIALRKVAQAGRSAAPARQRIVEAERMLLDRRCPDGGWNYGAREALGVGLPSYPETTGMALLGLLGSRDPSLAGSLSLARKMWKDSPTPMGRAWLSLALRAWGQQPPGDLELNVRYADVLLASLEAMSAPGGNLELLAARPMAAKAPINQ